MRPKILQSAKGGNAHAEGDYCYAEGGAAGDSARGVGGDGGHAHALGLLSTAIGGRGGRGGVGPGGPGGNAVAFDDHSGSYGGNGGESSQHDGRGGRGGAPQMIQIFVGAELARRAEMKLPYGTRNIIPGRGGDTYDTPQYMARRLIVEQIKYSYFIEHGLPTEGTASPDGLLSPLLEEFYPLLRAKNVDVWYDRTTVPVEWINEKNRQRGNKWTVAVEADEYVFIDSNVMHE